MNIVLVKDYQELSVEAANIVAREIERKKDTVLCLPTGQTPLGMYQELIKKNQNGELDFSKVITFNLDEYYGLSPEHPQSYHYYMWHNFFQYINIKKENVHLLKGIIEDILAECQQFDELIREKGGIDLQILGIGNNGHLGFNEPALSLHGKTHLVNLSDDTIQANSRFFDDINEVPKQALTIGMETIMKAKKVILLASGEHKAAAINKTVNGLISTQAPSTFLQMHTDATLIIDKEAASQL
ncbi:MAG TPA: glucosamine-6-phosphate deaminase [Atribacterota bacterium]|nr:glucosamine-6-phosphate deaminase [Atribacterota bacterium]